MRILRVAGANLASLAEPFDVSFSEGPLGQVGLFAIAGPTGSGKSTLLDALCLALFDATPRLDGRSGFKVGRRSAAPTEGNRDVRSLLTRGAGEGWVEVDFTGVDGTAYRARWSVRRARRRPTGAFQAQSMELRRLADDSVVSATKKTETLAAIREAIGLSFQQFRRSVLLAQGEFAAFLRASAAQRAELLETVTGLTIYGAVSRAAYSESKERERAVQALLQSLEIDAPLEPEARAALDESLAAAAAALESLRSAARALERTQTWDRTLAELNAAVTAANLAHEQAQSAHAGLAEEREREKRSQQAEPLRGVVRAVDEARSEASAALSAAEQAAVRLPVVEEAVARALQEAQHSTAARDAAQLAWDELQPQLQQAAVLDEQLAGARREVEAAQSELNEAKSKCTESESQRERALQAATDADSALQRASAWLMKHRHVEAFSEAWERVAQAARAWARARGEAAAVGETTAKCRAEIANWVEAEAQARTAEEAAVAGERDLAASIEEGDSAADLLAAVAASQERQASAHQQLTSLIARAALGEELAKADAKAVAATEAEQVALARQEGAAEALSEAQRRVVAARGELEAASRLAGLAAHRGQLESGAECPVCGSLDHPWAERPASEDLAAVDSAREALAKHQNALEAREAEARSSSAARATATAKLEAARSGAGELRERFDAQPGPEGVGLEEEIERLRAATAEGESELESSRARLREATKRDEAVQRARSRVQEAATQRRAVEANGRELRSQLESAQKRASELDDQLRPILRELERAFASVPGWEERLEVDCDGFLAVRRAEVDQYAARTHEQSAAKAALEGAQTDAQRWSVRLEAASVRREKAGQDAERRGKQLEAVAAQRQRLFGGRNREEVARQAQAVRAEAAARATSAQAALEQARDAERQARAAAEQARATAAQSEARVARTSAELVRVLADGSLEEAAVREALGEPEESRLARTKRLQQAELAVRDSAVRLESRRADVARHCSTDRGSESTAEQVALDVESNASQSEAADARRAELRSAVQLDDERLARQRARGEELERARADASSWAQLNELIGSADGNKFRSFAMGLALEELIGHANVHLRDLAPRYRLERAPGSELELQIVDLDMGDEIRSIETLSGGESFLVSLALALALSQISALETAVESLFIDEGFGTLDRRTLDTALGALDALQATGRQIGLISHVDGLAEQIGSVVRVRPTGGGHSQVSLEVG